MQNSNHFYYKIQIIFTTKFISAATSIAALQPATLPISYQMAVFPIENHVICITICITMMLVEQMGWGEPTPAPAWPEHQQNAAV